MECGRGFESSIRTILIYYIIQSHTQLLITPPTKIMIQLTSLMSPLLEGLSAEPVVETLDVRRSFGLCLITSLLRTNGPPLPRSAISDADFTANRDEASPPECVLLREGEWLALANAS